MPRPSRCSKCGESLTPEMRYCAKCGERVDTIITSREQRNGPDILSVLSVGVILILLGITYVQHPINPVILTNYLESMTITKSFIKPPRIILNAVTYFLYGIGAWSIILAGLRIIAHQSVRRVSTTFFLGGCFSIWCAYLLTNYTNNVITNQVTLAYIVIGIGFMSLLQVLIHFLSSR